MNWFCEINWTALGTLLLVGVTLYYAISTYYILKESQKTREATESLAESSKQTMKIIQKQLDQAITISKMIVAYSINAARTNIEQWNRIDIPYYAVHSRIPENVKLVPLNAESAVEHARLLSFDGAFDLASGFENLRRASWELNFLSKCHPSHQKEIQTHSGNAQKYMDDASTDLQAAINHLAQAIPSLVEKRDPD